MLWLFLIQMWVARADAFSPPIPQDLSQLDLQLLTVGLGDPIHTRYGHTMIRVIDKESQLDYVINWGLFDFGDPLFAFKFYLGKNVYRVGFSNYLANLKYYQVYEQRPIWQEDINLTLLQKRRLMEKIQWNAKPENIYYPYQYFLNNCATIPRDYLDIVLGGKLKERFTHEFSQKTYRDYVFNNLSHNPFVGWGLDILFNSVNDVTLTKWEEMFLPAKVSEYLVEMPALDDQGTPIPGKKLLSGKKLIYDVPEIPPTAFNPYFYALFGFGGLLIASWSQRRKPRAFARIFGLTTLLWGMTLGFIGFTHVFVWIFSDHYTTYHNVNLWLFWPIDLFLIGFGFYGLIKGRFFQFSLMRPYAALHLVCTAVYLVLALSGFFAQDVSRVIAFMVPLQILLYGMILGLVNK